MLPSFDYMCDFFPPEIPEYNQTVAKLGSGGSDLQALLGAVEKTVSGDG